jgi:RNA-binding motif X-linked protein 2
MNVTKEINRINEKELQLALSGGSGASWHDDYRGSPYIFVGNVPFQLTEGDLIAVFSQYVPAL